MTDTYQGGTDTPTLISRHIITESYDWAATPPTVTITVTDDASGEMLETATHDVPLPQREAHTFTAELATEFAAYKAALDLLITTLPNNAFTGARELKDAMRATRRMFRAAIRDVKRIDSGT